MSAQPPAKPFADNSAALSLTVNGEPRRVPRGASIADLVIQLGLNPAKVAVERNGLIVPRSTLAAVALADGDVLEIVHFVGGGDHPGPLVETPALDIMGSETPRVATMDLEAVCLEAVCLEAVWWETTS